MATFLLEWFRTDQNADFEYGGVAEPGGKTRYLEKSTTGRPDSIMQEQARRFRNDVTWRSSGPGSRTPAGGASPPFTTYAERPVAWPSLPACR